MPEHNRAQLLNRRNFMKLSGAAAAMTALGRAAAEPPASRPEGMTIIDFEKTLSRMRADHYRHPPTDIINEGFRPVGGSPADFSVILHEGRYHFFYIERRLTEGTPFYPGHEIYFGHASTADFFTWEVHDPVMLVRPGTWEEAHVWAPYILKQGDQYIMAYTGLNRHLSQDLGLASSRDMFEWKRWDSNPISPLKHADWAAWWTNDIASCRDPHLVPHDGRIYMTYTANTKEGATCIALASTSNWKQWRDHGPIIVGAASGYVPLLTGGHPQGSFESSNLSFRAGRWILFFHASIRDKGRGSWILQSDRIDKFDVNAIEPFWPDYAVIEVVKDHGTKSLMAGVFDRRFKFGQINWADSHPQPQPVTREQLIAWQGL